MKKLGLLLVIIFGVTYARAQQAPAPLPPKSRLNDDRAWLRSPFTDSVLKSKPKGNNRLQFLDKKPVADQKITFSSRMPVAKTDASQHNMPVADLSKNDIVTFNMPVAKVYLTNPDEVKDEKVIP